MPLKQFIPFLCLLAVLSCQKSDNYNEAASTDKTKPGVVTNVKVVNFNGGAYITYTLPNSQNILYVQANYPINNTTTRQTKSSYYSDSITVQGFAQSQDYQVTLYVVSRANVQSDPVVVTVHPLTPPYQLVARTLAMQPDFGGVAISGADSTRSPVTIVALLPNSIIAGKDVVQNEYTTNNLAIQYSLRGYDTMPKKFGLYVIDPYNNISDTLWQTINPLYEIPLPKSLFKPYVLPTDVLAYQNGYFNLTNLWDGNYGEYCYNTQQPILPSAAKSYIWPAWFTFDMGVTAKLSRYMVWDRVGGNNEFIWTSGAPQTWIMWGRADVPQDELMPSDTSQLPALGQKTPGGWINLGVFNAPARPADNPLTNADITTWLNGFNFSESITLPKVRYIRFECLQTMGGTDNYFNMNEITIYGNPN
ncbi:DUF4959 domain-containing protein [Puia dinghuensis]|uniref:DUF4959 domain-containing protein n=1 Tax=Puia dinghuensis TaxID=1792502 RepID=A0A8J2UHZ9_9BACT|nr:DUF4959 domain-containing protein [Puia dinghuensis]GGB20878.1 hypothetical protein GCM10011511_50820 [Puia dinghuensis]